MKPLKATALISSIVLVGGYVYLRAGGSERLMPSTKRARIHIEFPDVPATRSAAPAPTTSFTFQTPIPSELAVMSSSKSMSPVISSPKAPEKPSRTVMPGSKSHSVIDGDDAQNVLYGDGKVVFDLNPFATTQPTTRPATQP